MLTWDFDLVVPMACQVGSAVVRPKHAQRPHILYINSLRPSVRDGAQVRHRRTTGPGPAKPGFEAKTGFGAWVQADRAGVLSVEVLKPRSLLKLSPQSRVLSPDQYRSQVPTPKLQRPERLKKTWPGPGGA